MPYLGPDPFGYLRGKAAAGGSAAPTQGGGVSLPIAPAIDTPIVTGGPGSSTFATQTTHAPKRIGDNSTNVDLAGDTKFRYPGVPEGVLIPNASIPARVSGSRIPGGDSQFRNWDIAVETVTSSKFVGMNHIPVLASSKYLIIVNGRVVNGEPFTLSMTAGSANFIQMEFPDNRPRRVKVIFAGTTNIVNFQFEAAYPPARPVGNNKVLAVVADSMGGGAGGPPTGATFLDVWPHYVALMLGFDHCCNASIGGTKWAPRTDGNADQNISHFGGGRIAPMLTTNPSAVIFAGSRNDSSANQAATDAITAAVRDALDLITVPKFVSGTLTALTGVNNAVKAGADLRGVPFIDMTDGLQPEDLAGGDGIHPTAVGAVNLRNKYAPRLYAAGLKAS